MVCSLNQINYCSTRANEMRIAHLMNWKPLNLQHCISCRVLVVNNLNYANTNLVRCSLLQFFGCFSLKYVWYITNMMGMEGDLIFFIFAYIILWQLLININSMIAAIILWSDPICVEFSVVLIYLCHSKIKCKQRKGNNDTRKINEFLRNHIICHVLVIILAVGMRWIHITGCWMMVYDGGWALYYTITLVLFKHTLKVENSQKMGKRVITPFICTL